MLQAHGSPMDAVCNDGVTPLHHAAWHGHTEISEWLVLQGVAVMASNNGGSTPADDADKQGHSELAEWLRVIQHTAAAASPGTAAVTAASANTVPTGASPVGASDVAAA
ncbi:unnamed protein product, partial [Meganyctiphanes norvegica]